MCRIAFAVLFSFPVKYCCWLFPFVPNEVLQALSNLKNQIKNAIMSYLLYSSPLCVFFLFDPNADGVDEEL